jgi:hypothetical protein
LTAAILDMQHAAIRNDELMYHLYIRRTQRKRFLSFKAIHWKGPLVSCASLCMKPDQVSCESSHNGSIRGHFTVALLQLGEEAGLTITYNELLQAFIWHTRVSSVFDSLKFIVTVLTSFDPIPASILSAKVTIKIVFYLSLRSDPRSLKYSTGTKLF